MEGVQSKANASQGPTLTGIRVEKHLTVAQVFLRSMVIVCTLTAACLIFTSHQTTPIFGISFGARYSYEPAFRFLGSANVVACVLTLLSLGPVWFIHNRWTYFFLFLYDLVMLTLVMAACGAATAIGEVARHGNTYTAWMPICNNFGKFCNRVETSIIFSYLAVVMFLALAVLSVLRIQVRPISSSSTF